MKKYLLIFPPFWYSSEPNVAIPSLLAQLKNNNYNADSIDYNIEFLYYLLSPETITNSLKKIQEQYKLLEKKTLTTEEIAKFNYIKNIIEKKDLFIKLPKSTDYIITVFKTPELFYNPQKLEMAENLISLITQLSILPYKKEYDITHLTNYHFIKDLIFDKDKNIFLDFYEKQIKNLIDKNYDYIGISISDSSQVLSGLTLAYLLRNNTKAHINIGGILFSRLIYKIQKHPDFFDLFAHSISYEEGEISVVELAKYINNEIPIEKVPNLIYKKDNKIIINKQAPKVKLSKIYIPDYSDIKFDKYLIPERILPLMAERGCYWGKCAFCDMPEKVSISTKKIDVLIEEIKYYKEKYNVSNFSSADESISPALLEKFSDALIKNNLKIKFYIRARMEKAFTYKILNKAHKAGLQLILWGLESTNERILKLMNKGTNPKYFPDILKASNEAGIWNHVYLIYNFPTETYQEALETYNFIKSNKEYIHSIGCSKFILTGKSKIYENPQKYQIEYSDNTDEFCLSLKYNYKSGMTQKELNEIKNLFEKSQYDDFYELIYGFFGYDNIFRYLLHYTRDEIIQLYKDKKSIQ